MRTRLFACAEMAVGKGRLRVTATVVLSSQTDRYGPQARRLKGAAGFLFARTSGTGPAVLKKEAEDQGYSVAWRRARTPSLLAYCGDLGGRVPVVS